MQLRGTKTLKNETRMKKPDANDHRESETSYFIDVNTFAPFQFGAGSANLWTGIDSPQHLGARGVL